MDETDFQILSLLQENARTPVAEIARSVGLGASAIHQRIRKLEETGVIQGYEARLDPHALGRNLVSFVRVQTGEGARAEEITAGLVALPEVQEVHRVVGEDCFFVKVRVRDTRDLADLLDHRIGPIPNVASTKTTIVLTTAKETRAVPLDRGPDGDGPAGNRPPSRNGGESGTPQPKT
jgi:Lrp/AsnC family transcriptional regulator, leucine-responsive regulatory protein